MADTFLQARIAAIELRIEAYEEAMAEFAANDAVQQYTFDSGQTRQVVMRSGPSEMQRVLDGMIAQRYVMVARLNGSGTATGVPGW